VITDRQRTGDALVIAVDCSTTAAKAVAVDTSGRTGAAARRELSVASPHPGWHEQDPEQWWTATRDAIAESVAQLDDPSRVGAVCLTHQRESFVCLDADGRALRPAILWVDSRAHAQIEALGSDHVQALSGKPPDVTPAIYKLAWLAHHEPEVLKDAAQVGDVQGYLNQHLTGRWCTSHVSADALGLFDLSQRTWSDELLDLASVRRDQLPQLIAPGATVGTLTDEAADAVGLSAAIPVVAGVGDGQAAGLGADVTSPGMAYLNLGTAMVMGVQSADYQWQPPFRTLASAVGGTYILETLLSSGTYLATWFRTQFGDATLEGRPDPQLDAAAAAVGPGAEGLLTLPYWNAAQSPYWDPHARGAIIGWAGCHTRPHVYRSLLEGIAYELRLHLDSLEQATGVPVTVLRAMGGGTRSRLWTQIIADVTGRALHICAEEEISAMGAAVLGFARNDDHDLLHEAAARMVRIAHTVEPNPAAHEVYERFYHVYRDVYPSLRDTFPLLAAAARSAVRGPVI